MTELPSSVNREEPGQEPDEKTVEQIFTGDVTDGAQSAGLVGRSPSTPVIHRRALLRLQRAGDEKARYAGSSQKWPGNEQIAAEVGRNPNGVGMWEWQYQSIWTKSSRFVLVDRFKISQRRDFINTTVEPPGLHSCLEFGQ